MKVRIAFSGSGMLAPAHIGFVCAILDAGYEIVEVSGTSGGSIVASLVALGKTQAELKALALGDYPDGIIDISKLKLFTSRFSKCSPPYGNDGTILLKWLQGVMGNAIMNDVKIPLTIVATNLSDISTLYFNKQSTPAISLALACRASSSVPFVYKPILYNGKQLVDGGVRANIPTNVLQQEDVRIGVRINDGGSYNLCDTFGFSEQLISCLLDANEDNLEAWAEASGAIMTEIDATPYNFLNSHLPLESKNDLYTRGYNAGNRVIANISQRPSKSDD